MKLNLRWFLPCVVVLAAAPAHATAIFDVFALEHSTIISSGGVITGTGLNTGISLDAGDVIHVSAAVDDCWSAGAGSRVSNADGLTGALTPCTPGANFGLLSVGSFSAPFGALVGRIGTDLYLLGTSFTGPVLSSGVLELFYWDTTTIDNFGSVAVSVDVVPEPGTAFLVLLGLAGLGVASRKRR